MWIASKFGFFSIVQKQAPTEESPAVYHVRARLRADIENLLNLPGCESTSRSGRRQITRIGLSEAKQMWLR